MDITIKHDYWSLDQDLLWADNLNFAVGLQGLDESAFLEVFYLPRKRDAGIIRVDYSDSNASGLVFQCGKVLIGLMLPGVNVSISQSSAA